MWGVGQSNNQKLGANSSHLFYFLTPQIGDEYEANPEGQVGYKRFCDAMGVDMPKTTIEVDREDSW